MYIREGRVVSNAASCLALGSTNTIAWARNWEHDKSAVSRGQDPDYSGFGPFFEVDADIYRGSGLADLSYASYQPICT